MFGLSKFPKPRRIVERQEFLMICLKAMARGTLIICVLCSLVTLAQAKPEPARICGISFDKGFTTSDGQQPVEIKNVNTVKGRVGQGAALSVGSTSSTLAYPAAGFYNPAHGSVEFWVRPDWDALKVGADKIFWMMDSDAGQDNRVALGCFMGADGSSRVYFGNLGGKDGIAVDMGWRSGEWHHLAAYWDETLNCRALFMDGVCVGARTPQKKMPSQQAVFYLGSGVKGANGAKAVLDEFKLSSTSGSPEFLRVAATKNAYLAACEKLKDQFSLERVAKERTEVSFGDVQGMATPWALRIPIQPLHHPEMVFVLPDLSICVGYRNGIGLALGGPGIADMRFPKPGEITSKLRQGYQPIVESEWNVGEIKVSQTAFGVLPNDQQVTTGKEKHYVFVRLKVANTGKSARQAPLQLLTGTMNGSFACYGPYTSPISRWQSDALGLAMADSAITQNGRVVLTTKLQCTHAFSFQCETRQRDGEWSRQTHQLPVVRHQT